MALGVDFSADEQEGLVLVGEAELLRIEDDASFQRAAVLLRSIKAFRKKVEEITKPVIQQAHAAWHAALKQRRDLEEHAVEAERVLKGSITTYEQRVERERQAIERQQTEIREQAERAALASQAQTGAAVTKVVEDQALAEALKAEARGDTATAERILADSIASEVATLPPPAVFVPPLPMPIKPQAEGIAFRDHYRAEVEDFSALVRAVALGQGVATISLLQPNQSALDALARTLKEELKIPGVKLIKDRKAAASA